MPRRAVIQIDLETGSAQARLADVTESLQDLNIEAVEAGDGFDGIGEGATKSMSQVSKSVERSIPSIKGLNRAVDKAFSALVERTGQGKRSLESLEASFEDLQRRSEITRRELTAAFADPIKSIRGFERAVQNTFNELAERTGQGIRATDSMEAAFADLGRRAQLTGEDIRSGVVQAQQRVASSGVTMRSSVSSSAHNLGFEMVQATQDAKYGMAGLANQIPLMSEQFSQLTAKTGSTTGALKALGSSVLGPVGIIGAIALLLTFKDDIVSFFSDTEKSAEDAAEAFEDAASNMLTFQNEVAGFQVDTLEEAIQVRDTLQDRLDHWERINNLRQDVPQYFLENRERLMAFIQARSDAFLEENELRETARVLEENTADQTQRRLNALNESLNQAKNIVQSRKASSAIAEELEGTIAEQTEEQSDAADDAERHADATERTLNAYNALRVTVFEAARNMETVRRFMQDMQRTSFDRQIQQLGQITQQAQTIGGITLQMGPSPSAQVLQSAQEQGFIDQLNIDELLRSEAEEGTEEGTEEGISLGAQAGAAAFQGTMSTAVSEITRQIQGDWPRAITSAVLQALSSAAVQRLRKLLEGGGGNGGDKVSQALSLANTLLQSQLGGQQRGTPPIAGLNFLPGGGGGSFKFNSAQGALGIATIGQLLGRGIRPEKNKGAGLAALGGAGIGAILGSVIPGFGTLLGAGIGGGLGGLLGGVFEHGGTMPRSGLALVGEAGPELVAMRGGSRVESTGDTRRLVQEAASTRQDGTNAIVQKLDEVASRVEQLEVSLDPYDVTTKLDEISTEKNEFQST